VADDIQELNALIADYGREFQSPDPRRGPSLGSSRLYADYQPATSSEQAEMLLSMLPGIGEGLDVAYIAQGIEEKDLRKAGTGLGALLLPGVGAGVIKKVGENLPKHKQGLRSINIDDEDVLKTSEGDPVILYRGIHLHDDIEDAALSGKHRGDYATFMSDSPHVADSYAPKTDDWSSPRSAIAPFVVKPKKLIEYEDRHTRKNKANPDITNLPFSKIDFDRQAQKLGPGEVLVVRNVPDPGPAALITGPDDPKYWSYSSDIYATKDPSVLQSPFSAKDVKKKNPKTKVTEAIEFREGPPINIGDTMQPSLLTSDGKPPEALYRVVSREEFDKAQKSGKFTPSSFYERVHASSAPDMRYRNAPDDVVIKIKYDPDDGWYSKHSGEEVYGVTSKDIPISRISEIKQFKKGGSVVERSNKHEPKAI